ncbi:MAG: DUF5060 domain-containing protein, partial [Micromonosporaceae bacterium]
MHAVPRSTVPGSEVPEVECWDVLELDAGALDGGFAEGTMPSMTFARDGRTYVAEAFEEGGRYRVRFLPDEPGEWTYTFDGGDGGGSGTFVCTPPSRDNHGPVRVDGLRFSYADGTTHVPLGTTAYWWHEQDANRRKATLTALTAAGFTKVRMSVLPAGRAGWPDPGHLAAVERGVRELRDIGVDAELVLFHAGEGSVRARGPGPGWQGFLRQAVSRLAAYRNVSWCVAANADQVVAPAEGWDEVVRVVEEYDYGHHLLTLHGGPLLDFGRRALTHASVRHDQVRIVSALTDSLGKPVVVDSSGFEGDAQLREASLTAEEMVVRLWEATCRGGFASHGEWYAADDAAPWWRDGGTLAGTAAPRIAFLRTVMD